MTTDRRSAPDAQCPIRLGEPCSLCVPGASGPQDCGLVDLVMSDPDLREELARMRAERRAERAGQVSVR
jgi:hypothetical protein